MVKKIRHLIESLDVPPVIVYTDHSAAVPILKQTTLTTSSIDKLNLRLVRASQYLSGFNLSVRHKSGKSNVVPDALSRLPAHTKLSAGDNEGILDVLYGHAHVETLDRVSPLPDIVEVAYHITLVEMSDDFKVRLRNAYVADELWKRILDMLSTEEPPINNTDETPAETGPAEGSRSGIRFKRRDDLIYYTGGDGCERLYIPEAMESEVFRMAYDLANHGGYHRTYDRLIKSVYIRHLVKHLRAYITHCPDC